MKKFICILVFILLSSILIACSNQQIIEKPNNNQIYQATLTEEEKDILSLVGFGNEMNIYSFDVDNSYKTISIWLETYQNGELILTNNSTLTTLNITEGKLAIMVDKTSNFKWKISQQDDDSLTSYTFNTFGDFETNGGYSISSGALDEPVQITSDTTIVLRTYLFEDDDTVSIYGNQYYLEHPEVLAEYDYVYLLKCQFLKQTINEIDN